QAFDMLDVDRRVDIDAAVQQLFDVEIALGMPASFGVGVSELIDERDLRPASNDGIEVYFLKLVPLVFEPAARNDFKAAEEGLRLLAPVSLHHAHHDIIAVFLPGAGLVQHLVGLADPRRRADEYSELAGAHLLP